MGLLSGAAFARILKAAPELVWTAQYNLNVSHRPGAMLSKTSPLDLVKSLVASCAACGKLKFFERIPGSLRTP